MRPTSVHVTILLFGLLALGGCGPSERRPEAAGSRPGGTAEAHPAPGDDHGHDHGADEHNHEPGAGGHAAEPEEGHLALSAEVLRDSGVGFAPAGPRTLVLRLDLPGEVVVDSDRLAHIVPRFPGIAREIRKQLGDAVTEGEVLAVIESNESLTSYEVRSLTSGTIIEKHITLGEFVRDDTDIFIVADLASVWVNLVVPPRDLGRLRRGQEVEIRDPQAGTATQGRLTYIGPVVAEDTRSVRARVVIRNDQGIWRPGLFVTGSVATDALAVPVAVPHDALQSIEGRPSVFVRTPDGVEAREVLLGREDGTWIEVVSGLAAGEVVAVTNSFLLKAELGKSEAEHAH